jgi:hypothetical protein
MDLKEQLREIYNKRDTPENNKMLDAYFKKLKLTNLATGKPWKAGDTKRQWSAYRENTTAHKKNHLSDGDMLQVLDDTFLKKIYSAIRESPERLDTKAEAKLLANKLCRVNIPIPEKKEVKTVPRQILYPPIDGLGNIILPIKSWMTKETKEFMKANPDHRAVVRLNDTIKQMLKIKKQIEEVAL